MDEINNPIQANAKRGTNITYSKIISFEVCVANQDPQRAGRIRVVNVKGEGLSKARINDPIQAIVKLDKEARKNNTYKPWEKGVPGSYGDDPYLVNPFLPLNLNIIPRIGEAAKVITYDTVKDSQNREYVGPVISQFGEIKGDNFLNSQIRTSFGSQNVAQPDFAPNGLPICDGKGSFPNPEDVAIVGRYNTDIILGMREKSIIDECDDDPSSSPIPEDWYPQILIRSGKLIKNREFSSQPKTNKKPTFIQLNTFPQSLTAKEIEVDQSFRNDAPLATLVEWSLDQTALNSGNLSGKIEFFKMPYKNDLTQKVYMAGEFNVEIVIPPLALNVQTNKICTIDFTLAPSIEKLSVLINDVIKNIDDSDWSSLQKVENDFSTITYNPDCKPDEVGVFVSGMLHPLYFRPNTRTHRLIAKPKPVGAPLNYIAMNQTANDLSKLITLEGVKTQGWGLAFTNQNGKRTPDFETKKVKKTVFHTEPVQQGIISAGAEKIYLLSYNSTQINGQIKLGGNYGITQEKFASDIEKQTSGLIRGEKLIELLQKLVNVVNNHVHDMPGNVRVDSPISKQDLKILVDNADLSMINKNIRIN